MCPSLGSTTIPPRLSVGLITAHSRSCKLSCVDCCRGVEPTCFLGHFVSSTMSVMMSFRCMSGSSDCLASHAPDEGDRGLCKVMLLCNPAMHLSDLYP